MSNDVNPAGLAAKLSYLLALAFVLVGLLNTLPAIPGLEPAIRSLTGFERLKIRRFSPEYFYPLVFVVMMIVVVLRHSIWRSWAAKGRMRRNMGLLLDIALLVAALAISLTYMIELQAICLIDQ